MNAPRYPILFLLLTLFAFPMLGERLPERYERMLIPVLPVGSWSAALWIHNDGPESVDLFPLVYDANSPSRGTRFPLQEPGVASGRTLEYWSVSSPSPFPLYSPLTTTFAGAVLYVERDKWQNLRFQLHAGREQTQVPVVPEEDFVAAPMSLLRIQIVE